MEGKKPRIWFSYSGMDSRPCSLTICPVSSPSNYTVTPPSTFFFFSLANPEMTQGCYRLPNLRVLLGIGQHSNGPLLANFLEFSTGEDPVHYECSFFFPEYIPASCHCQRSYMRDTRGTEAWMGSPSRGPCSRFRSSPFPFPISHSIHSPTDTESSNPLRLPKSLWNPKTE